MQMTGWNQIVGHEWAVQLLVGAIRHGRVGHAYLITGPEQIGKTTLARTFAQALNCEAPIGQRPCGQCRACTLIAADRHPDVRLLLPEISGRGKLTIKIEPIRELQQALALSAHEARMKVAILKRFDAAGANAANAFLKTLEEPPANVVLLLTANNADTLLPTITSRCRTVALRPLPAALVEESLMTRWRVKVDEAHLLAQLADGRLGWAVQASRDPALLEARMAQLKMLKEAMAGNRVARFALAEKLAAKPETLPELLKTWLTWWRDAGLLAYSQGKIGAISNLDEQERLRHLAQSCSREQLLIALCQTETAVRQLEQNANGRLVLENLLLSYPSPSSTE
jgi:DNA polymerase-3 subunit delta'